MIPAEYRVYDPLPVGMVALRGEGVVYLNPVAARLFGATGVLPEEGCTLAQLAARNIPYDGRNLALRVAEAVQRGTPSPGTTWMTLGANEQDPRALRLLRVASPIPGDVLVVLQEVESDGVAERLAAAMAVAARDFVRCRDEQEVLEAAVEAVYQQGHFAGLLRLEGRYLVHAALRQDPRALEMSEKIYGKRPQDVRFDRAQMPHVQRLFQHRRALFSEDLFQHRAQLHAPEMVEKLRALMPPIRSIEVPIFVDGEPYGFLSVQGGALAPSALPTLELYGQLISGALENVRHQHEAAVRLQELTDLQRELVARERLAAVGQAAAVLSHEARNPLGAILNALAVLRKRPGRDPDDVLLLDIAEEEALRLDVLVRDLMELARPLEARLRPVQVEAVLEAALSDLRVRMQRAAPHFEVSLPPPPLPEVSADPTLLRVCVENLLRNAAQAAGGAPVRVSLRVEPPGVVFAVDDPREVAGERSGDEEFDPFSIMRARGSSLGLAVVKRLVEAQGGSVRTAEGGRRLEAVLPRAEPPQG